MRRTGRCMALVLAAGCSVVGAEGWERRVGDIGVGGALPAPLTVPATVQRGVPFTATVTTYGSSSCTREDGAQVSQDVLAAHVTPYDLVAPRNSVCTADLHAFPRTVTLRFDQAGEALVRVIGRAGSEPTMYQARVTVQP